MGGPKHDAPAPPGNSGAEERAHKMSPMSSRSGVLWIAVAAFWLARAVAPAFESMHAWGLNLVRFLPTWAGWAAWIAVAILLLPAVGRRCNGVFGRVIVAWPRGLAAPAFALCASALVWICPDHTWLTGDFILRQGTAETGGFDATFANALPGEFLLNRWLPQLVRPDFGVDPNIATRLLEAVFAGALAVCAVGLTGAWGLRGPARVVAAATIVVGGHLTTFTGLGKPAAVMCVLAASSLLGGTRLLGTGGGGLLLGTSVAAAILTHRAALTLLPYWLVVVAKALWPGPSERPARWQLVAAALPPVLGLLLVGPSIARIVVEFDLPRHLAPEAMGRAGALASILAPLRLLDLANMVLVLVPALPVALALLLFERLRRKTHGAWYAAAALALASLPVFVFVHPIQGVFRDLEVFAPAGITLTFLAALAVGSSIQRGVVPAWLVPAVLASVLVPSAQWLVHFHDADRGVQRALRFATESPPRDASEVGQLWDMLAYRAFRRRDWPTAVVATRASVAAAPSKRAQLMWGMARTHTGDFAGAESIYVALAVRYPEDPIVWLALGGVALRLNDRPHARVAIERLRSYGPGTRERRLVQETVRAFPILWPEAMERHAPDRTAR